MDVKELMIKMIKVDKKFVLRGDYSTIVEFLEVNILPKVNFNSIYLDKVEYLTKFFQSHYDIAIMEKENLDQEDTFREYVVIDIKRTKRKVC